MKRTPVHLVTGFLGAGKTTTVRRALERLPGRSAVVVNDFGEAAIDAGTLQHGGVRVANIAGVCVCCTAPENFVGAMRVLLEEGLFDRIFVEPTGLARAADLVDMLRRPPLRDRVELAPVVAVVDPRVVARGADAALLRSQAEVAEIVVINGLDRTGTAEIAATEAWLGSLWPGPARVVRTSHGEVPDEIWAAVPARASEAPFRPTLPSTTGFVGRSRQWAEGEVFAHRALRAAVEHGEIVRFKGVFQTDTGVVRLERAGGGLEEAPSDHRRGSACDVIVREGTDVEALFAAIEAARVAEVPLPEDRVEVALPDGRKVLVDSVFLASLPGGLADVGVVFPGRAGAAACVGAVLDALEAPVSAEVVVVAHDGFVASPVPRSAVAQAWLVYALAGGPLPKEHGGPFRWLAADAAARSCANVKAVARVVVR